LLSSQVTFRFDENWLLPSFLVEVWGSCMPHLHAGCLGDQ
jgi:hypothetical protein